MTDRSTLRGDRNSSSLQLSPAPSEPYKTIQLTQGKVALVSPEDYERVSAFRWQARRLKGEYWYAVRRVTGLKRISLHRFLMEPPDGLVVDHINHDGLDNRRSNLRIVTVQQNAFNMRPRSASGFVGVTYHKEMRKWQATIGTGTYPKYLGLFPTPEAAAMARDAAAYARDPEHAYFNFKWDFNTALSEGGR